MGDHDQALISLAETVNNLPNGCVCLASEIRGGAMHRSQTGIANIFWHIYRL